MEENKTDEIFMFDTLYTTNQIQILKILFPFLPSQAKSKIAVFIKWKELEYAIAYETPMNPWQFYWLPDWQRRNIPGGPESAAYCKKFLKIQQDRRGPARNRRLNRK